MGKMKKNGMSAPWPKLNIQNLSLELSRKKGFLKEVSCPQSAMQHASLGDAQAATSVLWGYDTRPPVAKEEKKIFFTSVDVGLDTVIWVPHNPEVWGSLDVDSCDLLQRQAQTGTIWMWIQTQIPTDFWLPVGWEPLFYL